MTIVASGSVAFDYILTYAGRFRDHILLDKAHVLNLSFNVESLQRRRGGCALNYAYNLRLLQHPAAILATAGHDGAEHKQWLESLGVDCRGLRLLEGELTATGFTTTDLDSNQLTGYYGGAMYKAPMLGIEDSVPNPEAAIVGPNDPAAIVRLARECQERGVRFVYDPAFEIKDLSGEALADGARGAWIVIGNDYEMELLSQKTGRAPTDLGAELVVTTLGRQGSVIEVGGLRHEIPPAPPTREVDPTGAGDAYRAGLAVGLLRGLDVPAAGRVASLAATWAVEQVGTVEHTYTPAEFTARYAEAFGSALPDTFFS
ncbi:MAG TPA: carbohydrate kinase family protein [Candidatus Dormibacteraeota bacterium]